MCKLLLLVLAIIASSLFAHAKSWMSQHPTRSCLENGKDQKICHPDACSNLTCNLMKEAHCVADRCGCEARFFIRQARITKDVSKICTAFHDLEGLALPANATKEQQETPLNFTASVDLFKQVNIILSEVLLDLSKFLQSLPVKSEKSIHRLRLIASDLRALKHSREVFNYILDQNNLQDEGTNSSQPVSPVQLNSAINTLSGVMGGASAIGPELIGGGTLIGNLGIQGFISNMYNGALSGIGNLFSGGVPFSEQAGIANGDRCGQRCLNHQQRLSCMRACTRQAGLPFYP